MFQQHDTRIQAVEAALQQLQDTQNAANTQLETKINTLGQTVQHNAEQTQHRFEALHQEQVGMHQALTQALHKQDTRIAASFDEIKQLFMSTKGTKRGPDEEEHMRE